MRHHLAIAELVLGGELHGPVEHHRAPEGCVVENNRVPMLRSRTKRGLRSSSSGNADEASRQPSVSCSLCRRVTAHENQVLRGQDLYGLAVLISRRCPQRSYSLRRL